MMGSKVYILTTVHPPFDICILHKQAKTLVQAGYDVILITQRDRKIVEGNGCGLTVDPLNPREIAEAIEYLLNHPEVRQKMGENGRRAVLEKYNWEKEARKLLQVYQGLESYE